MNKKIKLCCEQDKDSDKWVVWFPHPLGGMKILETFNSEAQARTFWQKKSNQQIF